MRKKIIIINFIFIFTFLISIQTTFNFLKESEISRKINDRYNIHPQSSGTHLAWIYRSEGAIWSVDISSDGKYLVAGSNDDKVYFFENSNSTPLWSYNTGNNVQTVAISSNGTYLIAGYEKNKISFFENSSSVPLWSYQTGYAVSKVAISSDGNNIVAGTYSPDNSVYFLSRVELFEDGNGDRLTISLGNIYILQILIIVISLVYLRKYLIRKQV